MTKNQHQQELLKKIKPGIKPSELKKIKKGVLHDFNLPPSDERSPSGFNKPDEGYESDSETIRPKSPVKNQSQDQAKDLKKEVKYWSQTAQTHLTNLQSTLAELDQAQAEIAQLQSQPIRLSQESEQAITEANQKIRQLIKTNQELQEQNSTLKQTITYQKKPAKTPENTNPEETPTTFSCASCLRTFNLDLIRLAKKSGKKICRNCTLIMLKRANQITGLRIVLKKKQPEPTQTQSFTCQTCHQSQPGEPHQVHITNYQDQGIIPQALTSICYPCLENKVVLANFYCPRTSEGKDTWNPKEPQFDCHCPINPERSNL